MTTIDFKELAAPIPKDEIKRKPAPKDKNNPDGATRFLSFITARTVMNRLDRVCGPQNWKTEYRPITASSIECTLYLRVDGEWIGKADIGTASNFEPEKGAYSEALKRAAVQWGIGRELYNEGTAYDDDEPEPRKVAPVAQKAAPEAPAVSPYTDAKALARDTFPFGDTNMKMDWQEFIAQNKNWHKIFWVTVRNKLGHTQDSAHEALEVDGMGKYEGSTGVMWLRLCETAPVLTR